MDTQREAQLQQRVSAETTGANPGRRWATVGQVFRAAALALVLVAIGGGLVVGPSTAAASNGYEQWVTGFSDGCSYFWDGYAYTAVACPRTDSGFNYYIGSQGQWVYTLSAGFLSDGGTWLYYQGQYYYDTVSNGHVNGIYPTTSTLGGATHDGLTNGGDTLGDPAMFAVANQFNVDLITNSDNTHMAPTCIVIDGDICYY